VSDSLFEQYKAALRRGHLAALAGELETALEAYQAAARLVPERALPVASQGTVLHRLDRWADASEAYEAALRMAPDDEATLRSRARARDERGLRAGAADDYERLAFVLDVGGRSTEAAEAARRAADLAPSAARESLANRLAVAAARAADLTPEAPLSESAQGDAVAAASHADDAVAAIEQEIDHEAPGDLEPERALALVAAPEADAEVPVVVHEVDTAASRALAARIAELGRQPAWVDVNPQLVPGPGQAWPQVDLPSPAPAPIEGPPPDPEALLAEAADLIGAGDLDGARDRMLLAAMVHRAAGRLDAALEVCLQLLTTAPGDPQVHLAIANLQLDRGWTALATEKIELLRALTTLTGDTQAQADVHGLAAERLRDETPSPAGAR
jgi:tetratricopeptide (TPR) repeat protein